MVEAAVVSIYEPVDEGVVAGSEAAVAEAARLQERRRRLGPGEVAAGEEPPRRRASSSGPHPRATSRQGAGRRRPAPGGLASRLTAPSPCSPSGAAPCLGRFPNVFPDPIRSAGSIPLPPSRAPAPAAPCDLMALFVARFAEVGRETGGGWGEEGFCGGAGGIKGGAVERRVGSGPSDLPGRISSMLPI